MAGFLSNFIRDFNNPIAIFMCPNPAGYEISFTPVRDRLEFLFADFSIGTASNTDLYDVRIGPLAKLTSLTVYMVAAENSRLDPYMKWRSGNMECDDAGRGDCKNVPSFNKAGVTLHEGTGTTITGDRSDAGLVLAPGTTDIMTLEMGSRESDTYGDYALFLLGQLPASK